MKRSATANLARVRQDVSRYQPLLADNAIPRQTYDQTVAQYRQTVLDAFRAVEDDLAGRLGYLQLQLFRARRLVVDTGLHEMRWTRKQAIDYGFTAAEIERYVVWPGQACSYMIGQLRIVELRERARAALGERFDVKAFHNLVLAGATMPLDVLEAEVDAWVKRAPGA